MKRSRKIGRGGEMTRMRVRREGTGVEENKEEKEEEKEMEVEF